MASNFGYFIREFGGVGVWRPYAKFKAGNYNGEIIGSPNVSFWCSPKMSSEYVKRIAPSTLVKWGA